MTQNSDDRDRVTEPGPSPINAERHGVWRILTISFALAVVAMAAIGYYVAA